MRRSLLRILVTLVVVGGVGMVTPELAAAAGPDPTTVVGPPAGPPLSGDALLLETGRVSKHLRCPVCQGLSVADSPSESAQALKDEVQALVAKGYDQEQILDYFEASYGEFIRLQPKAEGWNLLVWGLPPVMLLAGVGLIAFFARARVVTPGAGAAARVPAVEIPAHLLPYLERVRADVGEPK